MSGNGARTAMGAALLCLATSAPAQLAVYKPVDPAGHAAYIDGADASPPEEAQAKRRALPSRNSAMVNAREARRRLAQAELMRNLGKEPMAGETTQGPDGAAVNSRYWERQVKLRIEVDQALRRVNFTERRLQTANR